MTHRITVLMFPFKKHIIMARQGKKMSSEKILEKIGVDEGESCFLILAITSPLCKCTQPNLHSEIVSDQLLYPFKNTFY